MIFDACLRFGNRPLRAANRQSNSHLYDWVIASPSGMPAVASNGVEVAADGDAGVLQDCRMVFVCAGLNVRENTDPTSSIWCEGWTGTVPSSAPSARAPM